MRILEIITLILAAAAALLVSGSLVLDVVDLIKARPKHARETKKARKSSGIAGDPVVNARRGTNS